MGTTSIEATDTGANPVVLADDVEEGWRRVERASSFARLPAVTVTRNDRSLMEDSNKPIAYCMNCGRGVNPGGEMCCPQPKQ